MSSHQQQSYFDQLAILEYQVKRQNRFNHSFEFLELSDAEQSMHLEKCRNLERELRLFELGGDK